MILAMLAMMFSCQKPELTGPDTDLKPVEGACGEVKVTFSAVLPSAPQTRAMGEDPNSDIESMHLVIFDGNGMYVETRKATILPGDLTHNSDLNDKYGNPVPHLYEREFEVTLTVTDQPRIIHFIANCPIGQIAYGHEASIIGNMYVEKDADPNTPETAYWARADLPYILVQEVENADGTKKYIPEEHILSKFQHIPMLRNYAQVVVKNGTTNNLNQTSPFEFIGFTVYNTVYKGTVAPYNNTIQAFQSFVNPVTGQKYKYPALLGLNYRGHALAAAKLNTSPELDPSNDDGYKWYAPLPENEISLAEITQSAFYMYERKVSVKTDEEDKWSESPPHLIIKGRYDGKVYYYKVDLVHNVFGDPDHPEQVTDIEYYNILRNFRYQFTITDVAGPGYDSVQDAINGATSNNLSGSATTAKFTNISDDVGRLWVSYTDTTLVSNNTITLKYKFVPDLDNPDATNNVIGSGVILENMSGEVIEDYVVAENDIDDEDSPWDGFREITLEIKDPQTMTKEQTIVIKSANANLSRDVRYYLKEMYPMTVICNPKKVAAVIGTPVDVDIKLPVGLTEDMFPLDLEIEVYDMTLSPDASKNTMPVKTGLSVIPLPEKQGKKTFRFIKSIETKAEYDAFPTEGTNKLIKTSWLTNMANNGSTVYVYNKYFNVGSDNFINAKAFVAASIDPAQIAYGIGKTASISFTMDANDANFNSRTMTVTLNGLTHPNAVTNADGTVTLSVQPSGNRVVTVNGFTTTTEDEEVSFTVEEESYAPMTATASRRAYKFTDLTIPNRILRGVGRKVNISFTMDAADNDYANREVTVSFDGLADANGNNVITVKPQPESRKVEIKGLLTTSDNGAVQFTVSTAGYDNANSARVTERPRGMFTPVSFTYRNQTVTNIPTTGDEDVTFNFNLSDWEEGMAINVTLDGLEDNDASLEPPTRAVASYVYYPQAAGNHSIKLKSTAGAKTCKVYLSANGFDDAEGTLTQSDKIIIKSGKLIVNSSSNFTNNGTISIYTSKTGGTKLNEYQYTRSKDKRTATNTGDIEITGVSLDTVIYVRYTSGKDTYSASFTLRDATDNNGATLTLTRN